MTNGSRPAKYATNAPHRRRRIGRTTSVTAAVLAVLYGVPSVADEPPMQEIIVTATRRAASAQDIPLSITAISGDTLDQAGIQDMSALARSMAGFNFVDKGPFGGASGSSLIIRGLNGEALVFQPGLGTPVVPAVATYVDDTPLFVHLRLQDLDHVEILRDPKARYTDQDHSAARFGLYKTLQIRRPSVRRPKRGSARLTIRMRSTTMSMQ